MTICIILGGPNAGKSSLVNLIIQEHLLPEKILSYSPTIFQIFNNKQKKAVVIDDEGKEIFIDDVTEETLSKYLCARFSKQNKHHYKRVDIYWPIPILKVKTKWAKLPFFIYFQNFGNSNWRNLVVLFSLARQLPVACYMSNVLVACQLYFFCFNIRSLLKLFLWKWFFFC